MTVLSTIDILDEPDALEDAYPHECEVCGKQLPLRMLDAYGWCAHCRDNDDPSPFCNCGTCSPGNVTCVRED